MLSGICNICILQHLSCSVIWFICKYRFWSLLRKKEKKYAVNCEAVLFITLFITSSKRVLILLLVISITHSIVILIINTQTKHKSLHCKYTLSKITLANSAQNTFVCLPTTKGKNDIFYKVSVFHVYKILINMKVSLICTI